MITCPACRNQEYEGELFCANCGARLWGLTNEPLPTITFDTSRLREMASPPATTAPAARQDLKPGQISITVSGTGQALLLEGRPEYTIGREGAANDVPEANLGPYGARDKGVSRRHASLRVDRRQLLLIDLGSSNGTWLNGTQLSANEPIRLESGDELRLGKLVVKVYFNL
ncbi:MAG: FHA domain-containing protein [Anaerolineales bacterium]|nr:FHA domain-containing protein [Anaerolineales bacterium]